MFKSKWIRKKETVVHVSDGSGREWMKKHLADTKIHAHFTNHVLVSDMKAAEDWKTCKHITQVSDDKNDIAKRIEPSKGWSALILDNVENPAKVIEFVKNNTMGEIGYVYILTKRIEKVPVQTQRVVKFSDKTTKTITLVPHAMEWILDIVDDDRLEACWQEICPLYIEKEKFIQLCKDAHENDGHVRIVKEGTGHRMFMDFKM